MADYASIMVRLEIIDERGLIAGVNVQMIIPYGFSISDTIQKLEDAVKEIKSEVER